MVTQDWGKAGDYTGISAAAFFDITVSPAAKTISVTADDNVIDYLVLERDGGKLKFRVNANSTENISVSVTVPASASLREISAGSYGKVNCKMPLKGPSVSVSVSSYGSVSADIDTPGAAKLDVSSYGKFAGSVRCSDGELRISSLRIGAGSRGVPQQLQTDSGQLRQILERHQSLRPHGRGQQRRQRRQYADRRRADDAHRQLRQILRHGNGKRPAGEADRQQRRLVQRDIQRQFARSERRKLRQNLPERRGAGRRRHGPVSSGANFSAPNCGSRITT
ncbi:MAG: GIN domain-containing protein [Alistipes finegoldii]